MALSIKTTEADALARALAAATNESLTRTVTVALRERLDRVRERVDIAAQLDRLRVEYSALPVHDPRGNDDILGYDESGLPT